MGLTVVFIHYFLAPVNVLLSPVAVPGVASKVTTSSHARIPDVASSTLTLNIPPSFTLVIVRRETVASVESQIFMC